jgi:hypothetical protein
MIDAAILGGTGNFSLYHQVQNGSGAHSASYPMVPGALSLGIKRPGREADHSRPYNAEVKNAWRYTSTSHTPSWRGAQLKKKHRNNFTFYLYYASPLYLFKIHFNIIVSYTPVSPSGPFRISN